MKDKIKIYYLCKKGGKAMSTPIANCADSVSYKIGGKIFIVKPVYKTDIKNTIDTILIKLMQNEIKNST